MKAFRTYHLLFVLAVLVAYFTAEGMAITHAWAGYLVAAFLALRGLLGLLKASGFAWTRLMPLGSSALTHALTLALFLCIAGVTATGIVMDKGVSLSSTPTFQISREDRDESEGRGRTFGTGERHERESAVNAVHEALGNILLPLAIVHVIYLLLFRLDMARFMLFVPRKALR
ncbi:cytochrome b/b6 domain-containing protein [Novosphingobium naphthalenivorans]|uniref:cytochrome b/b6 domain-containing protein n=1 Tax=Novosphingobium naphthalenivorans TaxID=273168 RepID=UPI0008331502|nr:cytochrome b/b6 domain-containing protein [Novosphingobium naphthalenivorans]